MKKLDQYRGALSCEQVAQGMNAAAKNAKRLYEDAALLFEAKRFPSALSLAILSIEESGKLSVLRSLSYARDEAALRDAWKGYRDHRAKNAIWIFPSMTLDGAEKLTDFAPVFDKNSDHPAVLDALKQVGFYTDCCGSAHWSKPEEVIEEGVCKAVLGIANVLLPKREVSTREIELWVEHVGKRQGTAKMMEGALEYELAMHREGLVEHDLEMLLKFYGASLEPQD